MATLLYDQSLVARVINEIKNQQQQGQGSLCCYYKSGRTLIAVYSWTAPDETGVLLINKNTEDFGKLIFLIDQHCHLFNEEILVYTLSSQAMKAYEDCRPAKSIELQV